jgi:hypothetical protein
VSYQSQAQLESDFWFQQRNRAVTLQQASVFGNDERLDIVAVAHGIAIDDPRLWPTFNRLAAAGPGMADRVDTGQGRIDQSKVTDADLLSLTQANWPTVAQLYFNEDGTDRRIP